MTNYSPLLEPEHDDFERLSGYLRREKGIREKERVAATRLEAQYENKMMVFKLTVICGCDVRKGHPLGCAVLWETAVPQWLEVGTVFTHVAYRGRHYQEKAIDELLELEAARGKNLFAISSVQSFGAIVQERQFLRATIENVPHLEQLTDSIGLPRARIPSSVYRPSSADVADGDRALYLRFAP